jgi:hypothetical protein
MDLTIEFICVIFCIGVRKENAAEFLSLAEYFKLNRLIAICKSKLQQNVKIPISSLGVDLGRLFNLSNFSDIRFIVERKKLFGHKVSLTHLLLVTFVRL